MPVHAAQRACPALLAVVCRMITRQMLCATSAAFFMRHAGTTRSFDMGSERLIDQERRCWHHRPINTFRFGHLAACVRNGDVNVSLIQFFRHVMLVHLMRHGVMDSASIFDMNHAHNALLLLVPPHAVPEEPLQVGRPLRSVDISDHQGHTSRFWRFCVFKFGISLDCSDNGSRPRHDGHANIGN